MHAHVVVPHALHLHWLSVHVALHAAHALHIHVVVSHTLHIVALHIVALHAVSVHVVSLHAVRLILHLVLISHLVAHVHACLAVVVWIELEYDHDLACISAVPSLQGVPATLLPIPVDQLQRDNAFADVVVFGGCVFVVD